MASEARGFDVSPKEQIEISEIYSKLREAEAKLIGPDGKSEILQTTSIHSCFDCWPICELAMPSPFCKAGTSSPPLRPAKFSACPGSSWCNCWRREKFPSTRLAPIAAYMCAM